MERLRADEPLLELELTPVGEHGLHPAPTARPPDGIRRQSGLRLLDQGGQRGVGGARSQSAPQPPQANEAADRERIWGQREAEPLSLESALRGPQLIEPFVFVRVEFPLALMVAGAVVGATSVGWWFLFGSALAVYASLLAGHVAILVGFALRRSAPRLLAAVLLALVIRWPAVFGDLVWA